MQASAFAEQEPAGSTQMEFVHVEGEQHSPAPPHGKPTCLQEGTGWHEPPWQVFGPQQFASIVHAPPCATQVGGASHVLDVPQTFGLQQIAPVPQD